MTFKYQNGFEKVFSTSPGIYAWDTTNDYLRFCGPFRGHLLRCP